MNRRMMRPLRFAGTLFLLIAVALPAWSQDDEGPTASVKVVVLHETTGKPVKNARVVLHPVNHKGKQTRGEMDLKTDEEGRTSVDGIPYGSVEVQVLAPGFRTFGQDYEVKQSSLEITVKLKRPGDQYSVYENHDDKK
jgi:Carboxypeptidase regulatory-like domain